MKKALTLIRHAAAVAAAGLVTWLASLFGLDPASFDPELTTGLAEGLASVGTAIFVLVYAWAEKLLKPLFVWLGEVQPGGEGELQNTEEAAGRMPPAPRF